MYYIRVHVAVNHTQIISTPWHLTSVVTLRAQVCEYLLFLLTCTGIFSPNTSQGASSGNVYDGGTQPGGARYLRELYR